MNRKTYKNKRKKQKIANEEHKKYYPFILFTTITLQLLCVNGSTLLTLWGLQSLSFFSALIIPIVLVILTISFGNIIVMLKMKKRYRFNHHPFYTSLLQSWCLLVPTLIITESSEIPFFLRQSITKNSLSISYKKLNLNTVEDIEYLTLTGCKPDHSHRNRKAVISTTEIDMRSRVTPQAKPLKLSTEYHVIPVGNTTEKSVMVSKKSKRKRPLPHLDKRDYKSSLAHFVARSNSQSIQSTKIKVWLGGTAQKLSELPEGDHTTITGKVIGKLPDMGIFRRAVQRSEEDHTILSEPNALIIAPTESYSTLMKRGAYGFIALFAVINILLNPLFLLRGFKKWKKGLFV